MGSSGRKITSTDIVDGTIATADIAANAVSTLRLDYTVSTDLVSGLAVSGSTWTDITANQAFTVGSASSVVEATAIGCLTCGAAGAAHVPMSTRLVFDSAGTPIYRKIGGQNQQATGSYANPLAGSSPVKLTGLSVGSHTVKLQLYSPNAITAYLRVATLPESEFLNIQVTEYQR